MKRHSFDPLSFVFAIVFLALAGAFSIGAVDVQAAVLRWTAAAALVITGIALLMSSRSRDSR